MKLFLFTTDLHLALRAEKSGINSIIVDWETKGKDKRQNGYDLETNGDTPENVYWLSKILVIPVTVRINCMGPYTPSEVESALENGAQIIMLPMARTIDEVSNFLDIVRGRAETIIQIETPELAKEVSVLKFLNWDYAYIGLNDLMVAKGGHSIWEAFIDGTAESICSALKGRAYGFGGATILGGGQPIINTLILHELIRLGGSISVMRRTFKKELLDRDLGEEIRTLRSFIETSKRRGEQAKKYDYEHLQTIIKRVIKFNGFPKEMVQQWQKAFF